MPNTLAEYYQQQGQSLPSLAERMPLYSQYGISGTPGSAGANTQLLAALQGGGQTSQAQQAPQQAPQAQQSSSLWGQYSQKLAPITQQSDQLLKDYYALASQAPSFAQKLLDSIKQAGQYPSQAAMREEYSQNPNLTPMAVESLVSRRGQTTRGTIQDIIGRAQGGFESDVASRQGAAQMAQQQRENLIEDYGLARQEQQDILAQQKISSASTDTDFMTDLLKKIFEEDGGGGGDEVMPTEPQPQMTPNTTKQFGVPYYSPGGEWEWNWDYNTWIPAGSEAVQ